MGDLEKIRYELHRISEQLRRPCDKDERLRLARRREELERALAKHAPKASGSVLFQQRL